MTPEEVDAFLKANRNPKVVLTKIEDEGRPRLKKRKNEDVIPLTPTVPKDKGRSQKKAGNAPKRKKARVIESDEEEALMPNPKEGTKDHVVDAESVNVVAPVTIISDPPVVIPSAPVVVPAVPVVLPIITSVAIPAIPLITMEPEAQNDPAIPVETEVQDAPAIPVEPEFEVQRKPQEKKPGSRGKTSRVCPAYTDDIFKVMLTNKLVESEDRPSAPRSTSWFACVLWDSKILAKMKENEDCHYEAYTSRGIAKMLSKSVMGASKQLDWRKSHIVLEVVHKKLIKGEKNLSIAVAEQTWLKNIDQPINNRVWSLQLPGDMVEIASEIVRNPAVRTTLILWDGDLIGHPFKEPFRNGEISFVGIISPYKFSKAFPRMLIFHHEEIDPQRRLHIQSQLRTSELKHFHKPGVLRHFTESEQPNDGHVKKLAVYVMTPKPRQINEGKIPEFVKTIGCQQKQQSRLDSIVEEEMDVIEVQSSQINTSKLNTPKRIQKQKPSRSLNASFLSPPPAIPGPSSRLLPPPTLPREDSVSESQVGGIDDSQLAFLMSQDMQLEVSPEKSISTGVGAYQSAGKSPEQVQDSSQAYRFTPLIYELQ